MTVRSWLGVKRWQSADGDDPMKNVLKKDRERKKGQHEKWDSQTSCCLVSGQWKSMYKAPECHLMPLYGIKAPVCSLLESVD